MGTRGLGDAGSQGDTGGAIEKELQKFLSKIFPPVPPPRVPPPSLQESWNLRLRDMGIDPSRTLSSCCFCRPFRREDEERGSDPHDSCVNDAIFLFLIWVNVLTYYYLSIFGTPTTLGRSRQRLDRTSPQGRGALSGMYTSLTHQGSYNSCSICSDTIRPGTPC